MVDERYLLGLDIGTTSCKASLFDTHGDFVSSASREYSINIPNAGWAEQDIERVWYLSLEAVSDIIQNSGIKDIAGIGLSVHGEAVTPVDPEGKALRPTILGMDTRTDEQNEWLRTSFGADRLFKLTGMPIHTINTLPKILWIKENEPEVWKQADKFLLVEDYFIRQMTGKSVISDCLASRTQMFDIQKGVWSSQILNKIDFDPSRLSNVQPSGHLVGLMNRELSNELGLINPPKIVTGGHDQACGALGVGLTSPGLAMVSTGTAEVIEVALQAPAVNQQLLEGNISIYRHVIPGMFLAMTLNHSGGMTLRWFRDHFCELQKLQAAETGIDAYDLILKEAASGPTQLLCLPHFSGSGTPTFDTRSKGAILGLNYGTDRVSIAKAILEGLTFELKLNLDLLKSGGVKIDVLRAIGGGAKSAIWLQLKADITGIPVSVPKVTEASGLGAAILAGVGAGIFSDAAQKIGEILEFDEYYQPEAENLQAYQSRYDLYCELYPAVKDISHRL